MCAGAFFKTLASALLDGRRSEGLKALNAPTFGSHFVKGHLTMFDMV